MSDQSPKPDAHDPLRFEVPSDSRPVDFVVDLGAWGGFGECGCEDHQIRNLPLVREGDRDPRLRCKHIRRARESFADSMIARIIQIQPREESEDQR